MEQLSQHQALVLGNDCGWTASCLSQITLRGELKTPWQPSYLLFVLLRIGT